MLTDLLNGWNGGLFSTGDGGLLGVLLLVSFLELLRFVTIMLNLTILIKASSQRCGSGLIVCGPGSTKFSECGSGTVPDLDLGQKITTFFKKSKMILD